jgi:hypothetical protein
MQLTTAFLAFAGGAIVNAVADRAVILGGEYALNEKRGIVTIAQLPTSSYILSSAVPKATFDFVSGDATVIASSSSIPIPLNCAASVLTTSQLRPRSMARLGLCCR